MADIADGDTMTVTWRRGNHPVAVVRQTVDMERATVDVSVEYPDGRRVGLGSVEVGDG